MKKVVCSECSGSNVIGNMWVHPKTKAVLAWDSDNKSNNFCKDCDDFVWIKVEDENSQINPETLIPHFINDNCKLDNVKLVCSECKGKTTMEVRVWINPNTMELDDFHKFEGYCNKCEDFVTINCKIRK